MKKYTVLIALCLCMLALAACGGGSGDAVSYDTAKENLVNALAQELKAGGIGEDAFTEETPLPGYAILDVLGENEFLPVQVDASSVKQGVVIQAMMNVRSDLIVLIEVKDDAGAQRVQEALADTLASQEQTWSTYLPNQYEKVQNNVTGRVGNLLYYITSDHPQELEEAIKK